MNQHYAFLDDGNYAYYDDTTIYINIEELANRKNPSHLKVAELVNLIHLTELTCSVSYSYDTQYCNNDYNCSIMEKIRML